MTDYSDQPDNSAPNGDRARGSADDQGDAPRDAGGQQLTRAVVEPNIAALYNSVLLTEVAQPEQIQELLSTACGNRIGEFHHSAERGIHCEIDGNHLITVLPDRAPDEDIYMLHPVQTGDASVVDNVTSQLLVALVPDPESQELEREFREPRLAAAALHSEITAALATLPGATAVHSPAANVTFSASFYHDAVTNQEYPLSLCSVWVLLGESDDDPVGAATMGLAMLGHPELFIPDSGMDPDALYEFMLGIVHYVLSGETINPGDTMGLSEGDAVLVASKGEHPAGDAVPTLLLEFRRD